MFDRLNVLVHDVINLLYYLKNISSQIYVELPILITWSPLFESTSGPCAVDNITY